MAASVLQLAPYCLGHVPTTPGTIAPGLDDPSATVSLNRALLCCYLPPHSTLWHPFTFAKALTLNDSVNSLQIPLTGRNQGVMNLPRWYKLLLARLQYLGQRRGGCLVSGWQYYVLNVAALAVYNRSKHVACRLWIEVWPSEVRKALTYWMSGPITRCEISKQISKINTRNEMDPWCLTCSYSSNSSNTTTVATTTMRSVLKESCSKHLREMFYSLFNEWRR